MEVEGTQSSAPAPAAPAAASTSEHTQSAQNSPSPQVNVNSSGTPNAAPAAASSGKWTEALDPDLREYVTNKGFQDPKAVLESYRNLEKLRGVPQDRLLKLPEAQDAPEWNDVYSKLGKPATAEGYNLVPKDAKDPSAVAFTNWAKDTFLKNNLSAQQGQELVKEFEAYNQTQEMEANAAHTAAVQEQNMKLRKEWGAAYQQNINRAQAAYRQLGIPDAAVDSLEKSIGFDGVMKLFSELGNKVGEHTYIDGDGPSNFGNTLLTPEQANAKIKALKQDQSWTSEYLKGSVKHKSEMERLLKMANPTD